MQHPSHPRRFGVLAAGAIVALVAGFVAASPASAAPAAPTVHVDDGGDGFLNAVEIADGVMLSGTYDTTAGVTELIARITNDPTCAETAAGTATQTATLNEDGTWTAGPFDLSDATVFVEGGQVCARARASDGTFGDAGLSDNQPAIDTVAPTAVIDFQDADGLVSLAESDAGVGVAWTVTDGSSATVSAANLGQEAPAACSWSVAPTGTGSITSECFDALADGDIVVSVDGSDDAGNVGSASEAAVLDTVGPDVVVDILDGDGFIDGSEAASGVDLSWAVSGTGPNVAVSVAPDAAAAPAECTFADQARTGTAAIGVACLDALGEGTIVATVVGADDVGNESQGTDTSVVDATVADAAAVILDETANGGGYAPDVANADETENGTALKVRIDFGAATPVDEVFDVSVIVEDSDGNTSSAGPVAIAAGSAENTRTLTVDVTQLVEGGITSTATIVDGLGNSMTATDASALDYGAPAVSWTTQDGDQFYRLFSPLTCFGFNMCYITSGDLEGAAVDNDSPVQWVYIRGKNLDDGNAFGKAARLSSLGSDNVTWSLGMEHMSPGEWELSVTSQDEAGNISAPVSIAVFVEGL